MVDGVEDFDVFYICWVVISGPKFVDIYIDFWLLKKNFFSFPKYVCILLDTRF